MSPQHLSQVPPDAVRVWRGFRLTTLKMEKFHELLGNVFIPATVKLQVTSGLESYVPAVLAGLPGKPDLVPDETAVVFWSSQQAYNDAFHKLAVRTYSLTHGGIYDFQNNVSRSGFPLPFDGSLKADQSVYLFDRPAVWMRRVVKHFVAARPPGTDSDTFLARISTILANIKNSVELEGAIASVGKDYLVYWELGPAASRGREPPSGIPLLKEESTGWNYTFTAEPRKLEYGLWDEWLGMGVKPGDCFNMQFEKRKRRSPPTRSVRAREKAPALHGFLNIV